MKNFLLRLKLGHKGQSFMELTVVFGVLMLLLMGTVEVSILLNQYVTVVDAAREGARRGSSGQVNPYTSTYGANEAFFEDIDRVIEGHNLVEDAGALDPILLDPTTDDVIITFYRVVGTTLTEYGPWHPARFSSGKISQVTDIQTIVNSTSVPDSGVLVVEIFYTYHPIFSSMDIPVHTYTIMPLQKAKPTPVSP
jgi:hypothetical protein